MVKDHRAPRFDKRIDLGLYDRDELLTGIGIDAKIVKATNIPQNANKTFDICVCRTHFVGRNELRSNAYEDNFGSVEERLRFGRVPDDELAELDLLSKVRIQAR